MERNVLRHAHVQLAILHKQIKKRFPVTLESKRDISRDEIWDLKIIYITDQTGGKRS